MNQYFVLPSCPRDIWFGDPAIPETAKLIAFVSSDVNASWIASVLNEKIEAAVGTGFR